MDTSISNKNKGFKMLTKLGWSKGESLGKSSNGILEPVSIFFPHLQSTKNLTVIFSGSFDFK